MAVEVMTQYDALVQAGREARERADEVQWVEGDLALEVEVLPAHERPRDPDTGEFVADEAKALKRYADDIDISYSTLQGYRVTAQAWPTSERRIGVGWAVHSALNVLDDRFSVIHEGMSWREARSLVRTRTAGNQGKPGWLELIGQVGDDLIKAEKDLDKFESAIGEKESTANIRSKAGRYAVMAEAIALRLRAVEVE